MRAVYGNLLGNAHLLSHYGFVQRGGIGDQVFLVHRHSRGDGASYDTKRRVLEAHGLKFNDDGAYSHGVHAQQPLTEVLREPMTYARVMALSADETSEQYVVAVAIRLRAAGTDTWRGMQSSTSRAAGACIIRRGGTRHEDAVYGCRCILSAFPTHPAHHPSPDHVLTIA